MESSRGTRSHSPLLRFSPVAVQGSIDMSDEKIQVGSRRAHNGAGLWPGPNIIVHRLTASFAASQESLVNDMVGMARGMRDHAEHASDLLKQGNEVRQRSASF